MIANVNYIDIKDLRPEEAFELVKETRKYMVKEAQVVDLIDVRLLSQPIYEFTDSAFSPRGIYIFFNEENEAIYVGKTNTHYLQRLTTQLDTHFYEGWGWNSLLRILGGIRTGKPHDQLSEEEHEYDLQRILEHRLLLIEVNRHEAIDSRELTKLERILQKTFQEVEGKLINGNIGELKTHEWQTSINNIIKS